jgi:hypothetical protein
VTINGPGPSLLAVHRAAAAHYRIFTVTGGAFAYIYDLTITR